MLYIILLLLSAVISYYIIFVFADEEENIKHYPTIKPIPPMNIQPDITNLNPVVHYWIPSGILEFEDKKAKARKKKKPNNKNKKHGNNTRKN